MGSPSRFSSSQMRSTSSILCTVSLALSGRSAVSRLPAVGPLRPSPATSRQLPVAAPEPVAGRSGPRACRATNRLRRRRAELLLEPRRRPAVCLSVARLCFIGARHGHFPRALCSVQMQHYTPAPALAYLVSGRRPVVRRVVGRETLGWEGGEVA